VFLHEGLGSVAQWKDFPERVCRETGLGAFVYSRQGCGASQPVPAEARSVRFMHHEAHDVLPAVLQAARLNDVILVGHSDGASIALLYAGSDAAPAARGVVAMAPHLFVEDVTVASIATITETYRRTDLRARLAKYHGTNVDGAFLGWSGVWLDPAFRAWNIEEEASRIRVPVLGIQGADDEYGSVAQIEALERRARGGVEKVVLAVCGHAPHRDQPEASAQAIAAWIARRGLVVGHT
jgi:pimeloyl-ACP methyl ester carboxylesterase